MRHPTLPAPARGESGPCLVLLYFNDGPGRHVLCEGAHTIGRGGPSDVTFNDPTVSRDHALVLVEDGIARIKDLGSQNGTRVNGARIQPDELVDLDGSSVVEFGALTAFVRSTSSAPSASDLPLRRSPNGFPEEESTRLLSDVVETRSRAIVHDAKMVKLYATVDRVARSDMSVLIVGETGVGKELVAARIHERSARASRPLVVVNCAAIPDALIESELFGHERGAFTGANKRKVGLLASADGGTLVLDEVGELPLHLQAKLLRALEAGEVMPLGASRAHPIDVRFVASTNRDLRQCIVRGTFREDLFHRLAGIVLSVPPLRERRSDILPLATYFAEEFARQAGGTSAPSFTDAAAARLVSHAWMGNVRELRNAVGRAMLLTREAAIAEDGLDLEPDAPPETQRSVLQAPEKRTERGPRSPLSPEDILRALSTSGGNQAEAAKLVGVSRRTLINWMEKWNLPRPRKRKRVY